MWAPARKASRTPFRVSKALAVRSSIEDMVGIVKSGALGNGPIVVTQ